MAVYTHVKPAELDAFLVPYDIGTVRSFKGIAEGVENSNYLIQTSDKSYILTLFEKRVKKEDLPYFLDLMDFLNDAGVPSARPIRRPDGAALGVLCGKPAALIEFLDGVSAEPPTPTQARNTGQTLAALHLAGSTFPTLRRNTLGASAWPDLLNQIAHRLNEIEPGLQELLTSELADIATKWPRDLSSGVIHADLFPDNVLFAGDEVTGFIDFYFACNDFFAYDLAITVNAWCFDAKGHFDINLSRALMEGYQSTRALTKAELSAFPTLARGAATRFILTRSIDWIGRDVSALVMPKDPRALLPNLRFHGKATSSSAYGA